MDPQNGPLGLEPEQLFAEAAERIQAGEPFEVVVASYPAAVRRQLRELLAIVVVANEISQAEVPVPSESRSTMRRTAFLRAAALHRAEHALAQQATNTPQPTLSLWSNLQQWFAGLFMGNNFRPAAAALTLVFVLLASTSLVSLAEAAVPGDFSYPVKQWIRTQQLYLAAPEDRAAVRQSHEQELLEDVEKARPVVEQTNNPIHLRSVLLFHGYDGDYLNIGGLRVLREGMQILGTLTPGATVTLHYQILPGNTMDTDKPVVQGLSLEVNQSLPLEPTPPPQPTVAPTPCVVGSSPSGWLPVNPLANETVAEFIQRVGVSEAEFRAANCIFGNVFVGDHQVLIPASSTPVVPATPTATLEPSPTVAASVIAPTLVVSVTVPPTATPDLEPTAIITLTLVPAPTETAVISATIEPPVTPGITPVISPTEEITIPTPIVPTLVITITEEATPVVTPQPTLSATPVVSATEEIELTETPTSVDSTTPVVEPNTPEPTTSEPNTPEVITPEATQATPLPSATVEEEVTLAPSATPTVAPPTAAPTVADELVEQPVQPPTSAPTLPPTPQPPPPPVATEPPPVPTEEPPITAPPETGAVDAAGVALVESNPVEPELPDVTQPEADSSEVESAEVADQETSE